MVELEDALLETAKLTVMIFALIWGVLIFVRFLGYSGLPAEFAEWIIGLREEHGFPPVVIMILILCGYAILGMFMDAIGMLLLTLPVVYPAVIELGYSPIWFGIIVVKMCEVCLITPPVGLNCYVVAAVETGYSIGRRLPRHRTVLCGGRCHCWCSSWLIRNSLPGYRNSYKDRQRYYLKHD